LKFTAAGAFTWARGMGGPSGDYGQSIIRTTDGGYAVGGMTSSFGAGSYDFLLAKFDATGQTCTGQSISPVVINCSPTITSPSPTVTNPSPMVTDVTPTITIIAPTLTYICPVTCTLVATASISPDTVCEGDTIYLFGGPDGMLSYQWTGPDGFISTAQNPIRPDATMAMSGTYTLIIMDAMGCIDTATTSVLVNYRPYVYCMASGECIGDTIRLHGGGPVTIYDWTGPAGFTSSEMDPIIPNAVLANTGWYYFTGTDWNGCSNSCSVYVAIVWCGACPPPLAWIACPIPCGNFSACSMQTVVFGFLDTAGAGIDTMDLHFTAIATHADHTADTVHLYEPVPFINYTAHFDTIFANVWGNWTDNDSVLITFDSMSCLP